MKKVIIVLFTVLCMTKVSYSQTNNADIAVVQSLFSMDKRLIIQGCMQLNDEEQKSFWLIYEQYEKRRQRIERESFLLLMEYSEKYMNMDDAQADELIMHFMKSMEGFNNLHQIYFKKMKKAVGGLKAAKFIQIETFFQTTLLANVQRQVPVVGELERLEKQNSPPQFGSNYIDKLNKSGM